MKRRLARWLISRSIDDGRAVPRWVERLCDRDQSLREYASASRMLGDRLRDDASAWVTSAGLPAGATPSPAPTGTRHRGHRLRNWSVAAAVAVAFVGGWLVWSRDEKAPDPDVAESTAPTPEHDVDSPGPQLDDQPVPVERLALTGRRLFNRFADEARQLRDRRLAGSIPPSSERPRIATFTTQPAEQAGVLLGRSLLLLDRGVRDEGDRITGNALATVDYFRVDLPRKLAEGFAGRAE